MQIWYRRILLLLAAYGLQRILFFAFNVGAISSVPALTILWSMFDGLRFDLCVIATLNLPLIVIHALRITPFLRPGIKWFDHFISLLFLIANLPFIIFGVIDSRMFTFTGRRISPDMLAIGGDIQHQLVGVLTQYWYLTLPSIVAIILFSSLAWQRDHTSPSFDILWLKKRVPTVFVGLLFGFLLIRGGWQTKPLAPAHAYVWQPAALANMVLNSGMTVLRTPTSSSIQRQKDFSSQEDLISTLRPLNQRVERVPLAKGKNVVILIVESLGTEYVGFLNQGKGYTPFIDKIAQESIVFPRSFANGRRSIDAMPAIFAGVPAWRDQPFVTSPFAANRIDPLPKILSDLGYESMYFHGAANGSMHFDVFAKLAGFKQYIGANEYPKSGDHDGQWGIFDEPFLQFSVEKLSDTKEPFIAGIFTLTSHNPFKIPAKYQGKFPKGTLPIHEAIGYTDYAIGEFFRSASQKPWYLNTIFVITGDHTSLSDHPENNNLPGRFRVPIIFYDPSGQLPQINSTKTASHVDIKPTIMELMGISSEHFGYFGGPLFDPDWNGRFIQREYDTWYYTDDTVQVKIDSENQFSFAPPDDFDWQNPLAVATTPNNLRALNVLKAARQYFDNGMLDNNWYQK